jgi:hypothetical protein
LTQQLEYDELLSRLTEEALAKPNPIIIIDGRAGSGKTTFANQLQNKLFLEGDSAPRVIHMDDLYLGWDGLKDGVSYLQRMVLNPLIAKGSSSWQEYNWETNQRDAWREFSFGTPLIIEGCGSLNTYTASITPLTVWFDVPEDTRKERSLERDGDKFLQYWDSWAAQELDFIALEKSPELASFILRQH